MKTYKDLTTKFHVHTASGSESKNVSIEIKTIEDLYNLWKNEGETDLIISFSSENPTTGEITVYDDYIE